MDGAVGIRGMNVKDPGTDAFCTLSFAGGKPFRSKVKTVKGSTRLAINPVFNCDIWYPVSIPTMTQVIDPLFGYNYLFMIITRLLGCQALSIRR